MKKNIYILFSYWKISLMNYIEYRFNFWIGGLSELSWMLMYIIFINVMFLHVKTINGWNKFEMLILTFQSGLIDGIFTFFVVPGLRRLPEMIRTGKLDYILIKPINIRFNISFARIDITQIKNIIICILGIFYYTYKLSISIPLTRVLIYIILTINGVIIIYFIMFILMTISFWIIKMDIIMGVGAELITLGNKPISIYPKIIQKLLIYLIPLFAIFNSPVIYLIKNFKVYHVFYSFLSIIILFYLSNFLFIKGLKKYESTGS